MDLGYTIDADIKVVSSFPPRGRGGSTPEDEERQHKTIIPGHFTIAFSYVDIESTELGISSIMTGQDRPRKGWKEGSINRCPERKKIDCPVQSAGARREKKLIARFNQQVPGEKKN
jgi:hypothetical protein